MARSVYRITVMQCSVAFPSALHLGVAA